MKKRVDPEVGAMHPGGDREGPTHWPSAKNPRRGKSADNCTESSKRLPPRLMMMCA